MRSRGREKQSQPHLNKTKWKRVVFQDAAGLWHCFFVDLSDPEHYVPLAGTIIKTTLKDALKASRKHQPEGEVMFTYMERFV